MINYIIGLPRSGKSYFAVREIVTDFVGEGIIGGKSKTDIKYKYLYTNIDGLKIDEINSYFDNEDIDRHVYALDWQKLRGHIDILYTMALFNKPDTELISYCRDRNLHNAWFVFDESYKYFGIKKDEVLLWFLGYHGHLGMRITMITQNKKKQSDAYLTDSEDFLYVVPRSKSMTSSSLEYRRYGSADFRTDVPYEKMRVKKDPKIFELYHSGDIHKPPRIVAKFIPIFAFGFVFVAGMGYALYHGLTHQAGKQIGGVSNAIDRPGSSVARPSGSSSASIIKINCDDKVCANVDNRYRYATYPIEYIYSALSEMQATVLHFDLSTVRSVQRRKEGTVYHYLTDYQQTLYYVSAPALRLRESFPDFFIPAEKEQKITEYKNVFQKQEGDNVNDNQNQI